MGKCGFFKNQKKMFLNNNFDSDVVAFFFNNKYNLSNKNIHFVIMLWKFKRGEKQVYSAKFVSLLSLFSVLPVVT